MVYIYLNRAFCLSLFLIIFGNLVAQSDADNLAKYWQYRNTYAKQFVVVGDAQGQSIPFADVHPNEDISWEGAWNHQLACFPRPSGTGGLSTGDATLQLGIYMAVLSTEYALLKKDNISTDRICRELYYALKAFERIDTAAEDFFGNPGPNDPSFFLRDDIPKTFAKNADSNYYIKNYFAQYPADSLIHVCKGDYTCADLSSEDNFPGVTSQDQTTHLSVGFVLLQKYVDEEAVYNGVRIKEFGKEVYSKLFQGYKNNGFIAGKPRQVNNFWRIDYRSLLQSVYPFRRVMNNFFDGNELNTTQDKNTWLNLSLPGYLLSDKPYNHAMGLIWAAIGDAANNANWLSKQSRDRDLEVYALLNACLYDKPVGDSLKESDFSQLLDVAPCNLPCANAASGCPTPDNLDWNVGYRWTNNSRNSDQGWQRGFFNGVDYMLLYNLFHLKYRQDMAYYPPPPPPCSFFDPVPFDSLPTAVSTAIIDHPNKSASLSVFPNPGNQLITISLPEHSRIKDLSCLVSCYFPDGRKVFEKTLVPGKNKTVVLDMSMLPQGIYLLQVQTQEGVFSARWIKDRP